MSRRLLSGKGYHAVGGGGEESSEFQQFLDRIGTLNTTRKDAFRAIIDGWVADGTPWSQADAIYALKTDIAGNAAVNLKSSSYGITTSGSPTFTADTGYSGGTTKYLDTNFNATSGSPNYTRNSCAIFVYTTALSSGNDYGGAVGLAGEASGGDVTIYPHYSDDNMYARAQSAFGDDQTPVSRFCGWSRTGPNVADVLYYRDNAFPDGSAGANSVALTNKNFLLLTRSGSDGFTANLQLVWIGGGLTDPGNTTDVAAIRTRMATFAAAF